MAHPRNAAFGLALATLLLATAIPAAATGITPSFSTAPTGWAVDRYAPAGFTNVGTYMGQNDVLGISIANADGLALRAPAYQFSFFDTQGETTSISGGWQSSIDTKLYIPDTWADPVANGHVRTDMWATMTDGANVSDYAIIGFTNYGGVARLRYWDEPLGNWVDLAAPIAYNAWTSLSILFTGSGYNYYINGVVVASVAASSGTIGFQQLSIEAFNFNDASLSANAQDYTAHWANASAVPEPTALALCGIGLAAVGLLRRIKRS